MELCLLVVNGLYWDMELALESDASYTKPPSTVLEACILPMMSLPTVYRNSTAVDRNYIAS